MSANAGSLSPQIRILSGGEQRLLSGIGSAIDLP